MDKDQKNKNDKSIDYDKMNQWNAPNHPTNSPKAEKKLVELILTSPMVFSNLFL